MDAEAFIARWSAREGGAERANYQMFLAELCDVIDVARPDPAGAERERNDYVFERAVRRRESDEVVSSRRIDLYKKGCFILEAKQSRLSGGRNALPDQLALPEIDPVDRGRRHSGRNRDAMMTSARRQAEDYVFLLDPSHPAPPFIITCDVGHTFEIFADFSGTGRAYSQFRGRNGFRIYLEDLRRPEIRDMLAAIWTRPESLDPARQSARVTRSVAARLAAVSRSLERDYPPEEAALFIMRCIFCMFAEDVDLLPKGKFTALLAECVAAPKKLAKFLDELWTKLDEPHAIKRFFSYFGEDLRHFNGQLYRDAQVLPLEAEEIGELLAAARHDWREVDPAIFGTLLEQALDPHERRKLGAHYTPRAYVVRLVEATVMEPLRADWRRAVKMADAQKDAGKEKRAVAILQDFHRKLCSTRVLDPACGTGNFLYVGLQLMKELEGEVLEALADLGAQGTLGLDAETVWPRQFLGLERNPRAAAIAELVVWIGFLQEHYKNHSGHPAEPILRAFGNINFARREGYDAVLASDGPHHGNPRRPDWPQAEFIVGNPPFMGGKDMRARLGSDYAEALWKAHPQMNESADLVMYWWDRAAELLTHPGTVLRRFGLVTTNSISQVFQRRTVERHLNAKNPICLLYAIPDHPWTKATRDSAAVRIAMTVCEAGRREGVLMEVASESGLDTDEPVIEFNTFPGLVNSDLTTGVDLAVARSLLASTGLSSRGVQLMGAGFILTPNEATHLGRERIPGLDRHIRPYRNGRDITGHSRGLMVIDLLGRAQDDVRKAYPALYQHLLEQVKPERDRNRRASYRVNWWIFGEPRRELRPALVGLERYIATVETTKHRVFQFLDGSVLADNKIICVASASSLHLAVLHSSVHHIWYLANSGMLGVYDREAVYVKSRCFDPFPFPDPAPALRDELASAGEELDATRKQVLDAHPDLTMTGLYNVLEKVNAGTELSARENDVKDRGLVLILKDLHETIDRLTVEAYGWPAGLADDDILARLVALNAERAAEEAQGHVRWLRPAFQAPRFARQRLAKSGELRLERKIVPIDIGLSAFPSRREDQVLAVASVLEASAGSMNAAEIARAFKRGGRRIEPRVEQLLTSLARYGHVIALADSSFTARERERLAA